MTEKMKMPSKIRLFFKYVEVGLTDYAVERRYLGTSEPVTEENFKNTLSIAEEVVKWAE